MIKLRLVIQDVCYFALGNEDKPGEIPVLLPDATRPTEFANGDILSAHYPYISFRREDLAFADDDTFKVVSTQKGPIAYWFFKNRDLVLNLMDSDLMVTDAFKEKVVSLSEIHDDGKPGTLEQSTDPNELKERLAGRLKLSSGTLDVDGLCPRDFDPEDYVFVEGNGNRGTQRGARPRKLAFSTKFEASIDGAYLELRAKSFSQAKVSRFSIRPGGKKPVVNLTLGNSPVESVLGLHTLHEVHSTRDFEVFAAKLWDEQPTTRVFPARPGQGGGPISPGNCCPCARQ